MRALWELSELARAHQFQRNDIVAPRRSHRGHWGSSAHYKNIFTPNEATFRFSEPSFSPGTVSVTATNIGGQPATLDTAFVMIPQKTGGQPYIFDLRSSDTPPDQKIGPGETKILTYTFDHKRYNAPPIQFTILITMRSQGTVRICIGLSDDMPFTTMPMERKIMA